ncbi:MAG: hypothetical protein ACRCX8_12880 [Sarcina sp.]
MKNFTSGELTKAVEAVTKIMEESNRAYPIEFEVQGRNTVPVLLKEHDKVDDEKKKNSKKKVSLNLGDDTAFIKAELEIKKYHFIGEGGKEMFMEYPVIPTGNPDELLKGMKSVAEIFIAMRNAVITMVATNPAFVQNSTVEPPTGAVLADIIGNTSRLSKGSAKVDQRALIKEIIENVEGLEGSKLTAYLNEYNTDKNSRVLIEGLGYVTAVQFLNGVKDLIKTYDKIKLKGYETETVARSSEATPVVVEKRESKMTEVERRETPDKKLKSLI